MNSSKTVRHSVLNRVVRDVLLSAGMAAVVQSASANQLSREVEFRISSQRLAAGLSAFADQAGVQIISSGTDVENSTTSGVAGKYSAESALQQLLRGTGLKYQVIDDHTIVIKSMGKSGDDSSRTALLRVSSVDAQSVEPPGQSMGEVVIEAKRRASTATKFELPVIETPQSVKAVTEDVMKFASLRTFNDLSKVDASTNTYGDDSGSTQLGFRGFEANWPNGLKVDGVPIVADFNIDFGILDRIEILKGPSSTIYGQNAVGGMVNAVMKRPLDTFRGSVDVTAGSWDFYRFEGDVGGPVSADGRLSFRAYAAHENGGSFVDHVQNSLDAVHGALKYDLSDSTSVMFLANYQERDFTPWRGFGVTYIDLQVPDLPVSRYHGAPWAERAGKALNSEVELSHKLSNNWELKFNTQYRHASIYGPSTGMFGFIDGETGDVVSRFGDPTPLTAYFNDTVGNAWSGEISLSGAFSLLGRTHTFYVSVDRRSVDNDTKFTNKTLGFLNAYHSDYSALGLPRISARDFADFDFAAGSLDRSNYWGATFQFLLRPLDRMSVLLGMRWDDSREEGRTFNTEIVNGEFSRFGDAFYESTLKTNKFVPQVGVTYSLIKDLNLYANYGQSFTPQPGQTFLGTPIAPEEGEQVEMGIKGNFGNLTATLALFSMTRDHIAGTDPEHPTYNLEIGGQRSRGVELDAFGNITPKWSVYGSFAYLDTEVLKSDRVLDIGARLLNTPKYAFSLYSGYQIKEGPWSGFGIRGGVVSKLDRVWGFPSFPFIGYQRKAPDYTTVDLGLFYEAERMVLDLKVNNVTNEKYYNLNAPGMRVGLMPGRPREYIASIRYKF